MKSMMKLWRATVVGLGAFAAAATAQDVVTYYHNDHVGSPIAATAGTGHTQAIGEVLWTQRYQPYGTRTAPLAASTGNTLWFTGKRVDERTGLVYMGARYYDPTLGRFLSPDIIHFADSNIHSFNRYAYANNNPYAFVDPNGMWATSIHHHATRTVLGSSLSARQLGIINDAQDQMDRFSSQVMDGMAHRHAMSEEGELIFVSRANSENYIRKMFSLAWAERRLGNEDMALHHFGNALHVIQDDTASAHDGFQEWSWRSGRIAHNIGHVFSEVTYDYNSKEGKALIRRTKEAWDWYRFGSMPSGCILSCEAGR